MKGGDGLRRCAWGASTADYVVYHDHEWGRPVVDDVALYERLCLEGFQSGLSWLTILRKRDNLRRAFRGFDPARVARFGARDVQRLLGDAGIVRHRGKIEADDRERARRARRAGRPRVVRGADLVVCAHRSAAGTEAHGRPAVDDCRVEGAVEGPASPGLPLRRAHHGVRGDAGVWCRERPPRAVSRPGRVHLGARRHGRPGARLSCRERSPDRGGGGARDSGHGVATARGGCGDRGEVGSGIRGARPRLRR